jgi:hypothetical protein
LRARGRIRDAILQNRNAPSFGVVVSQVKRIRAACCPATSFSIAWTAPLFALAVIYIWLKLTV